MIGGGERNRTSDIGLMSPSLYQLSYAARTTLKNKSIQISTKVLRLYLAFSKYAALVSIKL